MGDLAADVLAAVRDIPDFPRPGILFKDLTPLLKRPSLYGRVVDWMGEGWGPIDRIVGMESRGFWFAPALVRPLDAGFVPLRKKGRLPHETLSAAYNLEYGTAELEIHVDAIAPGDRVLIVDDLIATGGTAAAAVDLVRRLGGEVVGAVFVIELGYLNGVSKLDCPVRSLVTV